jgi:hypothetical protein
MPNDYENPLNPENRQTPWEAASKPGNAKQFYDQVGSGAKALTAVPSGLLLANGRTFFRSDDRPTEEIFRDGFTPRDGQGIVYRLMKQDIHPHTAVCVTDSPQVAALFPIKVDRTRADFDPSQKEAPEETRVYVVAPKLLVDTYDIQARFAARAVRDQGVEQQTMADGNLYGMERAAPRIAPEDVIGAYTVKRTWAGRDYLDGGTYEVTGYTPNARAHAHDYRHTDLLNTTGKLAVQADKSDAMVALVDRYKRDGNVPAEPEPAAASAPKPDRASALGPVLDAQKTAQETVRATRAEQTRAWNEWKAGVSNPEQGITADTPVTVRRIDDRSAFLAEIEKFELRMGQTDEIGNMARKKHFDQGDNAPGTEQYVAFKNDVPVGWMTVDTSAGARIDKICTDAKPAHDANVGTHLLVEAVGTSLRHGGGGVVSMDGPETLKYASVDGSLYARMGFHDAGARSELFPSDHVRRNADGTPTYPRWEQTAVPLGTYSERGNERLGLRLAYLPEAGRRLEPTTTPQLVPPERPKLFTEAVTGIRALGAVKGLESDRDYACAAGSLAASAHEGGMTQIDSVVRGTKGNLIAVQGDPKSPTCQRASVVIAPDMTPSLESSLARLERPLVPTGAPVESVTHGMGVGGR